MARDYILEAADAIALRDIGIWKTFNLVIRIDKILCVGLGVTLNTDEVIVRLKSTTLENGLNQNQWAAIGTWLKEHFEGKSKCPKPRKQLRPPKPAASSSTSKTTKPDTKANGEDKETT